MPPTAGPTIVYSGESWKISCFYILTPESYKQRFRGISDDSGSFWLVFRAWINWKSIPYWWQTTLRCRNVHEAMVPGFYWSKTKNCFAPYLYAEEEIKLWQLGYPYPIWAFPRFRRHKSVTVHLTQNMIKAIRGSRRSPKYTEIFRRASYMGARVRKVTPGLLWNWLFGPKKGPD